MLQIVPERNRSFPVVDFVDTPGMTDEKSDYHFEVEDVILEMAQHKADLILVFLDPRGQAFCQRTIETAAKLFQIVPEKVKVFLSRVSHSQRAVPKVEPNVLEPNSRRGAQHCTRQHCICRARSLGAFVL